MKNIVNVLLVTFMVASVANAANSASIVSGSLVQGDVAATMEKGNAAYHGGYGEETTNLSDWSFHTGEQSWNPGYFGAISTTNNNFNAYSDSWGSYGSATDTVIAFGNNGSVTLKLDNVIYGVAGEKELGLFTAQMLDAYGTKGSFWNGNMEAAMLVSSDGINWKTLNGTDVGQNDTSISYSLNAPTLGYNYGTLANAWAYGAGATTAQLNAFSDVDYTTPMVDDSLFNGSADDLMRAAMEGNTSTIDYDNIFGTSGGGNWFDISNCGLSSVEYVQLNGFNSTPGMGIRLDAVFATDAATIPEPATLLFLGLGGFLIKTRRK
jgi:hypothetical protein